MGRGERHEAQAARGAPPRLCVFVQWRAESAESGRRCRARVMSVPCVCLCVYRGELSSLARWSGEYEAKQAACA